MAGQGLGGAASPPPQPAAGLLPRPVLHPSGPPELGAGPAVAPPPRWPLVGADRGQLVLPALPWVPAGPTPAGGGAAMRRLPDCSVLVAAGCSAALYGARADGTAPVFLSVLREPALYRQGLYACGLRGIHFVCKLHYK